MARAVNVQLNVPPLYGVVLSLNNAVNHVTNHPLILFIVHPLVPVHQVAALPVFNKYAHPPLYVMVSTKLIPVTPGAIVPVIVKYIVDHDIVALLVIDIAPVSIMLTNSSQLLFNHHPVDHARATVHAT